MQRSSIGRGLGCVTTLPAAFIGFVGLTDGIGPTGWRGFAELFGWIAFCVAASYGVGLLLMPRGWTKAWRNLAGLVVAGALTLAVNWLGLDAPITAKLAFTYSLQIIGSVAAVGCLVLLAHVVRSGRQRR